MTASERNKAPDFFENCDLDAVSTAMRSPTAAKSVPKKKAGFYLPETLLERFNRHFHQMKLAGIAIENKSALLETALLFALQDLDAGDGSLILKALKKPHA
ncbi:MAG: hypothetical protein HZB87_12645 [Desulfatitalea sp.]|nr:hypothetical protein [Desulfatitalea sp.]